MVVHFQECESEAANKMIEHLRESISKSKPGDKYGKFGQASSLIQWPLKYTEVLENPLLQEVMS